MADRKGSVAPMSEFLTTLATDAQEAARRCRSQDTPVHRRELIRSLFAAAEGFAWHLKGDVFNHTEARLTDHERAALREETYTVNDHGSIRIQTRFLPLISSLRLAVRIVQRYRPSYVVDFNDSGWQGLVSSVAVRNRLVHPKTIEELTVTDEEVAHATSGLDWLMKAQSSIAEAMRDESYKSEDLMAGMFEGLSRLIPDMNKDRARFQLDAEWREASRRELERHDALFKDVIANFQKQFTELFEGLAVIFPELEGAEQNWSGEELLQKFLKDDEGADETSGAWKALEQMFPDIGNDPSKVSQAEKLVEIFVSERRQQQQRLENFCRERDKRLSEIEARRAQLDSSN